MARALLIVPHFWDPICIPLGISSLNAYASKAGHDVELIDFNTVRDIFRTQQTYFEEGKRQFPYWRKWYIERTGTQTLAFHQILYLYARTFPNYRELVAEVLNMDERPFAAFMDNLDVTRFDEIFSQLYERVSNILEKVLAKIKPDVIGCSLFNSTWPGSLFILRQVKELMPHIRTVVGGPGPILGISSKADQIQTFFGRHDSLDYYIIGEGERQFLEILDTPDLPRGILDPNKDLPDEDHKKKALKINALPLPDYGNLDIGKYLHLSVSSSRGCPFECSFCAETVFWKGFRAVDKSLMIEYLDALANRYNRTSFFLCDSLSNHIVSQLTYDIASKGKPYMLDCFLRADPICTDKNRSKSWREGGLFRARLGMESASQRILDAMTKKTNPENMARSLESLADQGIMTSTLWIICYPGETEAEFESTLEFIRANRSNIFQVDAELFQYYPEGLANSEGIDSEWGSRYRYSTELNDVFAIKPYKVHRDFVATERFERLERFVLEMDDLQIPNPYNILEWVVAERRWENLGHYSGWSTQRSALH